ncbi:MAG: 6-phosphogluconolactonase [Actinomycetota bacterium]|nr:6-phosphogluconolactonase [Actinomycetota bacterium]
MELIIHPDPQATATNAAHRIADLIEGAEDRFTLGLAGGSTPAATYEVLRGRAPGWSKVHAFLSDERWVPEDHQRSNGRMAADLLMDHVDAAFYRPRWGNLLEPMDSAAHYEATVRSIHQDRRPDLILLGMGDDGHTASLFPGTSALEEETRWFVANHVPQHDEERITATFPMLWRAKLLIVLVVGETKAKALEESFKGTTPAGRLGDGDAVVEWHVDEAAASLLS